MAKKITSNKTNDGDGTWQLRLYVAGNTINSKNAVTQIKKICTAYLYRNCNVDVIDLRQHPEMALQDHIVALPTLVRTYPGPKKVLVGDLRDEDKVLQALEIDRFNHRH